MVTPTKVFNGKKIDKVNNFLPFSPLKGCQRQIVAFIIIFDPERHLTIEKLASKPYNKAL
jgi:hypothetical protein